MKPEKRQNDPDDWRPPMLALIGVGMGRDDLSVRALRWIDRAQVIAGGKRHLEIFPEHPGKRVTLASSLDTFFESIGEISREKRTAVLASGDPFYYGIGNRLAKRFGRDRILAVPNVTTVQSLFARLGQCWEDVKVISLHGRGTAQSSEWMRDLRRFSQLALFTDPEHTPSWIAQQLLECGFTDRLIVVAEDLGLPTERVRRFSLEEARDASFSPLNLVAILPVNSNEVVTGLGRGEPVLGLGEEAFEHEAGLITKLEVRAVALAHLQLMPDLIMWDLGAGSGSVSIEAARMASLKQVCAVEKNPTRFSQLAENVRRFRCPEVRPICGTASEVLNQLPGPDRVFIGGGGSDLEEMLQQVEQRLRPGGRVVQTAVTLDTLQTARSYWQGRPFHLNLIQMQVSRSVPIGKSLRLEPLNPVFVITVWRKS